MLTNSLAKLGIIIALILIGLTIINYAISMISPVTLLIVVGLIAYNLD